MTSAFVSYAREDRAFVGHLAEALRARSVVPAWDQDHSVLPFSAPWRQEIESAIRSADKFVFVISPDSIASLPCASEIATAQACGKQIVPIAFRLPSDLRSVPLAIGELNWIFFDGTTVFPQALDQLVGALTTDLEWTRMHTRLSIRAAEWAASGHDSGTLLRGGALRAAEAWIADSAPHPQSPPTEAQRQYLAASRRASDRNSRRWRFALIGGLVVALTLAVFAVLQRNQARHEATLADAHALAARASAALATDPATALHLALQSTQTAVGRTARACCARHLRPTANGWCSIPAQGAARRRSGARSPTPSRRRQGRCRAVVGRAHRTGDPRPGRDAGRTTDRAAELRPDR